MRTQNKIKVMKAWMEGKTVQYRNRTTNYKWQKLTPKFEPQWNWGATEYRIKPNSKKR